MRPDARDTEISFANLCLRNKDKYTQTVTVKQTLKSFKIQTFNSYVRRTLKRLKKIIFTFIRKVSVETIRIVRIP